MPNFGIAISYGRSVLRDTISPFLQLAMYLLEYAMVMAHQFCLASLMLNIGPINTPCSVCLLWRVFVKKYQATKWHAITITVFFDIQ